MAKQFKGFKKVSEDKSKVVMRRHDGHEFHIIKSALSPKLRGELAGIPLHEEAKMADGGEVRKPASSSVSLDPEATKQFEKGFNEGGAKVDYTGNLKKAAKELFGMAEGGVVDPGAPSPQMQAPSAFEMAKGYDIDNPQPQAPGPSILDTIANNLTPGGALPHSPEPTPMPTPTASDATQAPGAAPAQAPQGLAQSGLQSAATPEGGIASDPYGLNTQYGAMMQGINEQKAGLRGEAMAMGQQGARDSATLQDAQSRMNDLKADYQNNVKHLDEEGNRLQQDILNGHIDPNHYVGSMDTLKRVRTAIGLVLGGIGAGMTGTENLAGKMLQNNIDRDVEAQKADLNKKQTLYSANLQKYQNARLAHEATVADMNGIVSLELKKSAAQAQDPIAKSRALQQAGALDQQSAQIRGSIAMRSTMLNGMKSGSISPEQAVNFLIPQDQRGEAVKELKEAKEMVRARDNGLHAFDEIARLNTVGNSFNPQAIAKIRALKEPLKAELAKSLAGKYSDNEAHALDNIFSGKLSTPATVQQLRQNLLNLYNQKMEYPTIQGWGIDPDSFGRYNSKGVSRIQHGAPVLNQKK